MRNEDIYACIMASMFRTEFVIKHDQSVKSQDERD